MIVHNDCNECKSQSIKDVVCDICGNSCKIEIATDMHNFIFATLSASFGYGSTEHDGEEYTSEICEKCFFVLRNEHKIKAKVSMNSY